jgi:uncharacterized protein YegP (UPF0339 family)
MPGITSLEKQNIMATEIILENNLYAAKWNANHGKF